MGNLKYFIVACTLALSSCEFNPLNFISTSYDVNARFADSMDENASHPANNIQTSSGTYSFSIGNDSHIEDEPAYLPAFFNQVTAAHSNFVLFNGDIYNAKEEYAENAKNYINEYCHTPIYYIAGNHDSYFDWNYYFDRFGSSTYRFTVKTASHEDLFIVLESGSATLGKDQLTWLKEALKKRSEYRYCFIITHTNFKQSGLVNGSYQKEELHALYQLFYEYNINYVISGHAHEEDFTEILNVNYLTVDALEKGYCGQITVSENEGIKHQFFQVSR